MKTKITKNNFLIHRIHLVQKTKKKTITTLFHVDPRNVNKCWVSYKCVD